MRHYLADHLGALLIIFLEMVLSAFMLWAFRVPSSLFMAILFVEGLTALVLLLYDIIRKYSFYHDVRGKMEKLDQKYLITELIDRPSFYEGQIFYDQLYQANKSMLEHIQSYEHEVNDFKEFIEMWIHQVKTPIASLSLLLHKEHQDQALTQLSRIENYTSQVLYYIRSQSQTKDYLIKKVNLSDVINHVLLRNKDDLLAYRFTLQIEVGDVYVESDSKWLEFILEQIVSNAIKYRQADPLLKMSVEENEKQVVLSIEDHGIGIKESDLPLVFKNSYTGYNGHIEAKATGMGLFIVKKLCDALGHQVSIESQVGVYTRVILSFGKHDYELRKET